jgi:hypothetical protein
MVYFQLFDGNNFGLALQFDGEVTYIKVDFSFEFGGDIIR